MKRLCIAMGFASVLATGVASAAGSTNFADEYTLQSWDERHGLPSGRIWSMAQDVDGYLWLGTESGLIRFDGVRFTRWTSDAGVHFPHELIVFSLHYARDGSLWMGFQSGGLGRIRNGQLERFGAAQGIAEGRLRFVMEDQDRSIWAGGPNGIYEFRDGRWSSFRGRMGLPDAGAFDAFEDHLGRLWITTDDGAFVRQRQEQEFRSVQDGPIFRLSEDVSGTIWATEPQGLRRLGQHQSARPATLPALSQALLRDRTGLMWVGTVADGVVRTNGEPDRIGDLKVNTAQSLSSNSVRSLLEDRDGNIWVGTDSGLNRLTKRKIRPADQTFYSLAIEATPDGRVWVGTNSGLLEYRGDETRLHVEKDGLPSNFIRALFTDHQGTLWVATERGVARQDGSRFKHINIPDFDFQQLIAIAVDSRGTLWLCDRNRGAFVWHEGRLSPFDTTPAIDEGRANFVYVDRHDRLWVGYPNTGVLEVRPDGKSFTHLLKNSIGAVLSAVYEDTRGDLWIGGSRGLARIKNGAVDVLPQPTVLPGTGVFAIAEGTEGDLWLGVSSGVLRLRTSDFDLAVTGASRLGYRYYDASDGLVGVPPRLGFPGAARRSDGSIWFITTHGASIVRPEDLTRNTTLPTLRIETVRADDQPVSLLPNTALPAGTSQLFFEYTAVNLTSPAKERFRYQLEGVDRDWVEAGTRRQVFYANLASGAYRFRLARVAVDGATVDEPVAWSFTIRPMFYETAWFMGICLISIGLMAWAAWQIRSQQLRRQFALVFAERARMSHELHDTLLQNLAAIALHFDHTARNAEVAGSPLKDQLVRLRQHIENSIFEARRFVWDLRSSTLEESGLVHVLQESGGLTFGDSLTRFAMRVSGAQRRCAPTVEYQLMRIAQEALSNAARHAKATEVLLDLEYEREVVRMAVSDDGCGLREHTDDSDDNSHYGLRVMKERATAIGATFRLVSHPGGGTRIEVVAPLTAG